MSTSVERAREVVGALVAQGTRHVVLCPGSRSSALAYVLEAADRAGLLRLHVRIDERSAGFLALGLAKRTRVPAPVVTTSGTAVANLHPAVLEAHHARVPMVVLSADRPAELRGTGANQTTLQPGLFGFAVDHEVDLAPESPWGAAVAEALSVATRNAGPVHLNLQFREPLVPAPVELATLAVGLPDPTPRSASSSQSSAPATDATPADSTPADSTPADGRGGEVMQYRSAQHCNCGFSARRLLVVVGDVPDPSAAEPVLAWARRHGIPAVAEPFGTQPDSAVVPAGSLLLADATWLADHTPDLLVVVGRPTLTRPVSWLLRSGPPVVVVETGVEFDVPKAEIHRIHPAGLAGLVHADRDSPDLEAADLETADLDAAWAAAWFESARVVRRRLTETPLPWPSALAVARTMTQSLPGGARVFLGSSNAVRDVDLVGEFTARDIDVVASRGLAGIDGCVSTAVGLALADPTRPTYALLGDLTFLHDGNGLLIGPAEDRPDLTFIVPNDDGGGIFTLLEPGEPGRAGPFERIFATPTGADLSALCRAHAVEHRLISSAEELATEVARHPSGIRVLEVQVDRAGHRALHEELRHVARGDESRD